MGALSIIGSCTQGRCTYFASPHSEVIIINFYVYISSNFVGALLNSIDQFFRWQVRLSRKSVPRSQSRLVRYELDSMSHDHILWRPYRDIRIEDMPSIAAQRLWTAKCPLIFNELVEWCYTDRVTRQFGFRQDVPQSSPEENHRRLHGTVNEGSDWVFIHATFVQLWESRMTQTLSPVHHPPAKKKGCTKAYAIWYESVTRRFIMHPSQWSGQHGFQGTQGHSQYYVSFS